MSISLMHWRSSLVKYFQVLGLSYVIKRQMVSAYLLK